MQKVVVILGPTASGKTSLGISLAKKFNGEIISADSRQVYVGMDLGTGKASKSEQRQARHHLIDVASPKRQYTINQFKRQAEEAIKKISAEGKVALVVGGSAFYIYGLIDGWDIPPIKPNSAIRSTLHKLTTEQLFQRLKKLDPVRAQTIDRFNQRRLIRAVEIVELSGKPVPPLQKSLKYDVLFLGVNKDRPVLRQLIENRLEKRIRQGMIAEARQLLESGLSLKRMEQFGLEYRFLANTLKMN